MRKNRELFVFGFLFLFTAIVFTCVSAHAGSVALPHANFAAEGGEYQTVLVFNNPTPERVAIGGFLGPVMVQPFSTLRLKGWPAAGGGVTKLEVPAELQVYVEVKDPIKQRARVSDLGEPLTRAQVMDLITEEGFVSYLFIHAPTGSAFTVTRFRDREVLGFEQYILRPGETVIPEMAEGTNRVEVTTGWRVGAPGVSADPVYLFALISHRASRGEQFPAYAQPLP